MDCTVGTRDLVIRKYSRIAVRCLNQRDAVAVTGNSRQLHTAEKLRSGPPQNVGADDWHVELMGVCDGWVSKCSDNKLAEFDQAHVTNFSRLSHVMVRSTPIRLESDSAEITLDMIATRFCKFRIDDEQRSPIDIATVYM